MDAELSHPTYKFTNEQEADAVAWVFVDTENMKRLPFKFPELKSSEVRAKVTYTGLCHSDCHTVRGDWRPCLYPIAPGHEIVGVVTHVGADITNFKIGDKVGFGCQRDCCDECEFCKISHEQLCKGVEQKFTYGDKYWGGYASHVQHPAKFFFKLPEGLPEDKIPPLLCAGVTVFSPITKYAKAGQNVAVLGVGGLGHLAVQYAKAWGCNVTGFTSTKSKEDFIKGFGADRVVVTNQETLTQEAGKYHLVLNTLPDAEQLNSYVSLTRPLGTFCQLGLPDRRKQTSFNPALVIFGQVNFVGSLIGSRKDIEETLEFSAKHKIVSLCETFDFEEFPQAYDRLLNGRPLFRCVVDATKVSLKQ